MHFTQEQVVIHTKAPQYMHCARTACSTPSVPIPKLGGIGKRGKSLTWSMFAGRYFQPHPHFMGEIHWFGLNILGWGINQGRKVGFGVPTLCEGPKTPSFWWSCTCGPLEGEGGGP